MPISMHCDNMLYICTLASVQDAYILLLTRRIILLLQKYARPVIVSRINTHAGIIVWKNIARKNHYAILSGCGPV